MNFGKNKLAVLFFFLSFFFPSKTAKAVGESFVTIAVPVRGGETWGTRPEKPLDLIKLEKGKIDKYQLKSTWLLRSDVVSSQETAVFFKSLPDDQELGVFFEIMPRLAAEAGISYPSGGLFWHDANKIFLSGYQPQDRLKLIDKTFENFKSEFGNYPKSVGAWHIDAFSAEYLQKKYQVTGVLICADQFGTDNYQIWGGWWGVPYYPSKFNILTPAQSLKNKLNLVILWWAARDPQRGYGGSVSESTYSVQVNDYLSNQLGIDYFKSLLDIYLKDKRNQFSQLTIGLENDNNWQKIGNGFDLQLEEIKRRNELKEIAVVTMSEFSNWYKKSFTGLSPKHQIGDWTMNTKERVFISEEGNREKSILDLRIYNEKWPEANLLTANPWETLSLNTPYKIDTVRFPGSDVGFQNENDLGGIIAKFDGQKIPFIVAGWKFYIYYAALFLAVLFLLRKNLPLSVLVILGSVQLSVVMVKSGLVYPYGMGFWGPNGHDGIWHISLINQLENLSLRNPVFSGAQLTNYHFGFDFITGILSKLTGIVPVNLYFQIVPPAMAVCLGILAYKFVKKWTLSAACAWWATFFVYFGGSWGWLVGWLRTGKFGGESTFWANQAISTLINPPFALSVIIFFWILIKLLDFRQRPKRGQVFLTAFLIGILFQIKVYAGIIALGSLLSLALVVWISSGFNPKVYWKLACLSFLVFLVLFLPFNLKASSLLLFSPLWFSRTMLAYSDRLGWFKLESARIAYLNSGKLIKWVLAEGLSLTIFVFGNIGTRAIGILFGGIIWKRKEKISSIEVFLLSALVISLILPLVFIQKGNPWNTIQFFYYFQILMAIFAGVVMGNLWTIAGKNRKVSIFVYVISGLIILFTLPTSINTLKNDYMSGRPPARVSIEELQALKFLQTQPDGVVLSPPFNPDWRFKFSEPRPLYAYETTGYISALSGKISFLEDEMNLEISGYDWAWRRDDSLRFFLTNDAQWARNFLAENSIRYIYLATGQKMNLGLGDVNGKLIFENGEVRIFGIN